MKTEYHCHQCHALLMGFEVENGLFKKIEIVKGQGFKVDENGDGTGVCGLCGAETPIAMMKALADQYRRERPQ